MLEIQRALTTDLPQIVSMEQEEGTKEFIMPYSLEEHTRRIAEPELVYLRIVNDEALVGFFILGLDADGTSVEFRRIVVSTKGKGVGQAAIKLMEQFCQAELCRNRIWLDVYANNDRGRHIYEKLGYVQFGSTEHEGAPMLLYEKLL